MVVHWSLSDSKSSQVSWTLFNILTVLNNVVVWMVSTRPLISKSSSPFNNSLVTVLKAPITIGMIVTLMFHSFLFQFPSKVEVLILFFTFLQFYWLLLSSLLFHSSISWGSFTWVRVTANLLGSLGLFSVFDRSQQRCSLDGLFHWFPIPLVFCQAFGDRSERSN